MRAPTLDGRIFHSHVTMRVEAGLISPSGCPIHAGEKVSKRTTYRVVKVGDRAFNATATKRFEWIGHALAHVSGILVNIDDRHPPCDHYRIVEIPPGEPWDYDGTIVASLKTGRGVE